MMNREIVVLAVRNLGVGSLVVRVRRRALGSCRSWSCRRCNSTNHLLSLGYTRWTMLQSVACSRWSP